MRYVVQLLLNKFTDKELLIFSLSMIIFSLLLLFLCL